MGEKTEKNNVALSLHNTTHSEEDTKGKRNLLYFVFGRKEKKFGFALNEAS